jgi:hypothetical protein
MKLFRCMVGAATLVAASPHGVPEEGRYDSQAALSPDPRPQPSLPHNDDREGGQPYAKEVEDYAHGVAKPPKEQDGPKSNSTPAKAPRKQ